jgi:hypothetical protein
MTTATRTSLTIAAAVTVALGSWASAAHAQNSPGVIANNDGVFIDAKTFQLVPGKGRGDVAAQIKTLGAREIGPGAIIFRSGDKLYIAGAPVGPQANAIAAADQGPIHVAYEAPKNPAHKEIFELIKQRRGLETFRELLSPFRLPEDLYLKASGCDGVPNAYFFREKDVPTIRICYEYLQEIWENMPKETTPTGITPHDAVVGQLLFALMHEFGHAAFDLYNVPIFGRQEDAADEFSTYVMLEFGGEKAHRLVKGAAYSYKGFIKDLKDKPKVTVPLAAFSSDHGAPEERFFNLLCIAYGHDPKIFAEVVDKDYLPEHRAKVCKYEYSNLRYAFRTMIGPHIDQEKARKVLSMALFPTVGSQAFAPAPAK